MKKIFLLLATLYLVTTFDYKQVFRVYLGWPKSIAVSDDTRILIGDNSGFTKQISPSSGYTLRQFHDHPQGSSVIDIFWVQDTVVEVNNLGGVIIRNSNLDLLKYVTFENLGPIFKAAYNHAKNLLVLASSYQITVVELKEYTILRKFVPKEKNFTDIALSNDGDDVYAIVYIRAFLYRYRISDGSFLEIASPSNSTYGSIFKNPNKDEQILVTDDFPRVLQKWSGDKFVKVLGSDVNQVFGYSKNGQYIFLISAYAYGFGYIHNEGLIETTKDYYVSCIKSKIGDNDGVLVLAGQCGYITILYQYGSTFANVWLLLLFLILLIAILGICVAVLLRFNRIKAKFNHQQTNNLLAEQNQQSRNV